MARTVCWFSAGAASAVAAKLVLRDVPDAVVAYCETGSEHPDNERFLADCSAWFDVRTFIDISLSCRYPSLVISAPSPR